MVSKTCVLIFVCVGLFVVIQTLLPKALALKRTSDVNEFMVEDKRTHLRQNYIVQRALDNEMLNDMDYVGPKYTMDSLPVRTGPDPLPEFIVDYANMIKNDIILLDNSVETRTRKTGNIKVKKQNQVIPEVPCKCEIGSQPINLTKDWGIVYPYILRNITCDESNCEKPYTCIGETYNITILKRRAQTLTMNGYEIEKLNRQYEMPLPNELVRRWAPKTIPITTRCLCKLT